MKKTVSLLICLSVLGLIAGCGTATVDKADSVRIVTLSALQSSPGDDNTLLIDDAGDVERIVDFFDGLETQEAFDDLDSFLSDPVHLDSAGNSGNYLTFMSGDDVLADYVVYNEGGQHYVQFEEDGPVLKFSDSRDSDSWYDLMADLAD